MHYSSLLLFFSSTLALQLRRPGFSQFHQTTNQPFKLSNLAQEKTYRFLECQERWFTQDLDHFNGNKRTYQQRYYVCDQFFNKNGPIFFYTGNEGDVHLYMKHTGLIWENAEDFGALIVFAEHRYYGKSIPDPPTNANKNDFEHLKFLSSPQAMADFAILIKSLKKDPALSISPVIAFGGSYGGMLTAWMRMKYPHIIAGGIAGSAPILGFGEDDGLLFDSETYWSIVTRDATTAVGADARCAGFVRESFAILRKLGESEEGRQRVSNAFKMCTPLQSSLDVYHLMNQYKFAFDTMAMGNFPYASDYLTGGNGDELPPFPVASACSKLVERYDTENGSHEEKLVLGLRDAGNLFLNVTGTLDCNSLPDDDEEDGIWDFQWCTEMLPQETYLSCDGVRDMFWAETFNYSNVKAHCQKRYGVTPKREWVLDFYGGVEALKYTSNIVFTNGNYDPWKSGGVLQAPAGSKGIVSIIMNGGHHQDLMFSDPKDHPSVVRARKIQLQNIKKWIDEYQP